jgi:hypothetical protein
VDPTSGRALRVEAHGEAALQDVAVDLEVFLGRPDVDPVAAVHMGGHVVAACDQRGEEAALDRVVHPCRHEGEGASLQHVDPGVDVVRGDLGRVRLLHETQDAARGVGFDEAEGGGVLDGRQDDGGRGAAAPVLGDDRREVHVRQDVSVEDDGRLVEVRFGVLHGSARAEG